VVNKQFSPPPGLNITAIGARGQNRARDGLGPYNGAVVALRIVVGPRKFPRRSSPNRWLLPVTGFLTDRFSTPLPARNVTGVPVPGQPVDIFRHDQHGNGFWAIVMSVISGPESSSPLL